MNWTRALHDMITNEERFDRNALFAAIARDTVYLPSELAARLLPIDTRTASTATSNATSNATRDRSAPGGDLRALAH
jgi:hypothetical protein